MGIGSRQMGNDGAAGNTAERQRWVCGAQGAQAAKQLQRNMASEAELIGTVSHMYAAVITPHQAVCGDLAGWPQDVNITRFVRYLGADATDLHLTAVATVQFTSTGCNASHRDRREH